MPARGWIQKDVYSQQEIQEMEMFELHKKTVRQFHPSQREATFQMIKSNEEKVKDAIVYLRSRDKYLLDGCKWVPTLPDKTDVRQTMQQYRKAVK